MALGAGLSVGFGGLAAGYAIGVVGDYVSREKKSKLHNGNRLICFFFASVCSRLRARNPAFRYHGSDSYFCRSSRSIRSYRCADYER